MPKNWMTAATVVLLTYATSWGGTPVASKTPDASNGLAPEVVDLNAADVSFALEQKLPYLKKPFINASPKDRKDGLSVGALGIDGGDRELVLRFARELA